VTERRRVFGEEFVDLGNFTVVALIFGQLVLDKKDVALIITGVLLVFIFWMIGFLLLKSKRRKTK